ncbi:MAG: DNA methyltransferase, partial [Terrisporobacter sp.]
LKGRSDDAYFATSNEFLLIYSKNKKNFSMKGFKLCEEELEKDYDKQDDISYYRLIGLRKTGTGWERKNRPYMYYPLLLDENNKISTISEDEYVRIYKKDANIFDDSYVENLKESYTSKGFNFILPKDNNGNLGRWRWGYHRFLKEKNINIELNSSGNICSKMRANLEDGSIRLKSSKTTWYKPEYDTGTASAVIKKLFNNSSSIFEFSKSPFFIKDIIEISDLKKNDIVLDFFSGAATTAHSLFQLNIEDRRKRKFIMVQLPEVTDEKSVAYKDGYKNICEIGKERIRRAGDKIVSENKDKEGIENLDIGFKVFKLDSSNLKSWDSSIEKLEQNILNMDTNLKKDRTNEDLLYEILLKSGIELTAKIEKIKVGYNTLYNVGEGALLVCLDDKITIDVIDEIPKHKSEFMETKVIFKESGFMSDSAKINAIQNLKQFKITDVRSV